MTTETSPMPFDDGHKCHAKNVDMAWFRMRTCGLGKRSWPKKDRIMKSGACGRRGRDYLRGWAKSRMVTG